MIKSVNASEIYWPGCDLSNKEMTEFKYLPTINVENFSKEIHQREIYTHNCRFQFPKHDFGFLEESMLQIKTLRVEIDEF